MEKNEYCVEQVGKSSKILTNFFLDHADQIRLTRAQWSEIGLFYYRRKGTDKDPRFQQIIKSLEPDFIKKIINNKKYNDAPQLRHSRFEHYFYRLSEGIKQILRENGLTFYHFENGSPFYGFEDPTFYKNNELLGSVISHENMAVLYLTQPEADELRKAGVSIEET